MSKYIKPTISLLNANLTTAATSTCSTGTVDAKEVIELLRLMGYNTQHAFSTADGCIEPVDFEDYCKFSSGIQIFYS